MSEHLPETKYLDPEVLQKLGDLELIAREVVEGLRVGSHRSPLRGSARNSLITDNTFREIP